MLRTAFALAVLFGAATPAAGLDGATLYAQRCVSCHERGAVARAPARDVIGALAPDRIVAALESGTMRAQGEGLTPDERRAIANYLSSVAPSIVPVVAPHLCPLPTSFAGATAPIRPVSADWASWGGPDNLRVQLQPGFSADQVANLKLKWAFGFDGENAAAASPTIVGDRVFVGTASGRVFALSLKDGCQYWAFKADGGVRAAVMIDAVGGGGASAYFGDLRATVYSVDAASGELRWKQKIDDHRAARVTGSTVIHNGVLYVPVSSSEEASGAQAAYACCTFRGSIVALNATTGQRLWQTYMIAEAAIPRSKNRAGTQLWGPAGAAVWSAPTIDPATKSLYVVTGDGYTEPAAPMTDAIVALDLETGAIKWANQVTAGDAYTMACGSVDTANCPEKAGADHDFGQSPILVTVNGRRALVVGQKSGVVHAFDPDQRGKKLWSTPVGQGGLLGGIEWGSASDGVQVYVPVSDLTFKDPVALYRGGLNPSIGGGLFALRIADGTRVWAARPNGCGDRVSCSPALSAPASATPGAVFVGSIDGHFRAYSTNDGHLLWDFDTAREFRTVNGVKAQGGSIDVGGPAIANGVVVTTSGYPQWGGMRGNVLLVFSVDGR